MKRSIFVLLLLVLAVLCLPAAARAQTATPHGIKVTCTAPTTDVNGNALPSGTVLTFDFWRATSAAGPFTQVNSSPVSGCAFLDPPSDFPANPAGTYVYEVTAIDTGGQGNPSATVTAVVPSAGFPVNPGSPTAVTATVQ